MQTNHKEFPDDMRIMLNRLIQQKQIIIAATLLKAFFKRVWQIEDQLASYYVTRYFQKYHSTQLEKYLKKKLKTN